MTIVCNNDGNTEQSNAELSITIRMICSMLIYEPLQDCTNNDGKITHKRVYPDLRIALQSH